MPTGRAMRALHQQRSGRFVGRSRRRRRRVGGQRDLRFVLGTHAVVNLQVRLYDDLVKGRVQHCQGKKKIGIKHGIMAGAWRLNRIFRKNEKHIETTIFAGLPWVGFWSLLARLLGAGLLSAVCGSVPRPFFSALLSSCGLQKHPTTRNSASAQTTGRAMSCRKTITRRIKTNGYHRIGRVIADLKYIVIICKIICSAMRPVGERRWFARGRWSNTADVVVYAGSDA